MSPPLHRRQAPPIVVARVVRAALLVLTSLPCASAIGACTGRGEPGGRGELTVVLDSIRSGHAREVVIVPADPDALLVPPTLASPLSPAHADSVTRWRALTDSASVLDRRFQKERDAINREARAMEGGDRRSIGYVRRYDALQVRTVAAESLRTTRDRVRQRAAARRPSGVAAPSPAAARARLLAATDGERRARTLRPGRGSVSLRLAPGAWWIGVADPGDVPPSFTRITLRAGARDTVSP